MSNQRGQRGSVRVESGSWLGYWNTYSYEPSTDTTKRKQRSVRLGPKSLSKFKAYKILAGHIERSVQGTSLLHQPDSEMTLENFTRTRWLPTKESRWRESSKAGAHHVLSHIFKKFGRTPLERVDKIDLQNWLNGLALTHSKSLVLHSRFYLKSILEEAVDQDYLVKNPAKKLETPKTKKVDKSTLTPAEFRAVLAELAEPYNLLVRVGVACALRPSELLALRWKDFNPKARTFTICETIYRGKLRPYTKTTEEDEDDSSLLTVAIPDVLVSELMQLRGPVQDGGGTRQWSGEKDFIFVTNEGGHMHKDNLLHRVLYPVRKKLKLPVLNFQVMRRTMATLSQHSGSVKDVQSHLRHRTADISANEYMQPLPESARQMVNTVYADLLNAKK
jgi:integrase